MKKYYFKDEELWLEIKISKGKGKRTKRLNQLLILISENIFRKFSSKIFDPDLRHDIYTDALIHLLKNYNKFDSDKYEKAGPYITEVFKRAYQNALMLNMNKKKYYDEDTVKFVRLDLFTTKTRN